MTHTHTHAKSGNLREKKKENSFFDSHGSIKNEKRHPSPRKKNKLRKQFLNKYDSIHP